MQKILIIAGSDSGAGAGIQADIKSAAAQGVYASTAITSITAQNTLGVQAVYNLPEDIIYQQINSVLTDIGASVIKTGMLSTEAIIKVVARSLDELSSIRHTDESRYPDSKILNSVLQRNDQYKNLKLRTQNSILICDPVMVAKGGHKLLDDGAINALKTLIISNSYLVTPNIPEAEVLSGIKIHSEADMILAGQKIIAETGCNAVLVKGGHMEGDLLTDILIQKIIRHTDESRYPENKKNWISAFAGMTASEFQCSVTKFSSPRIKTKNTHGTGCSYASAIAANLAKGQGLEIAVQNAHNYIHNAIKNAVSIGRGHSPIKHF